MRRFSFCQQDEAKPKKKRGWKFWKKPAATSEQQPQQQQKLSDRELELSVELEQARQQIKALLQALSRCFFK
jgi:hypothetical protein